MQVHVINIHHCQQVSRRLAVQMIFSRMQEQWQHQVQNDHSAEQGTHSSNPQNTGGPIVVAAEFDKYLDCCHEYGLNPVCGMNGWLCRTSVQIVQNPGEKSIVLAHWQ